MRVFSNETTALISFEGGNENGVHELPLFRKESNIFIGMRRVIRIKHLADGVGSGNGNQCRVERSSLMTG